MTPLVKMHTLGNTFCTTRHSRRWTPLPRNVTTGQPPLGDWSNRSHRYPQMETVAVGIQIAKVEGIIPAPEANPAVVGAICEALR